MKRTLSFLLLASFAACQGVPGDTGDPGAIGDKGEKGDKGDPGNGQASLTALLPSTAFAARTMQFQLTGVATRFAQTSSVTFDDPAINVTKMDVGSGTNLRLTVEIGAGAKLGTHDLQISSPPTGGDGPNEDLKLTGALWVSPSLTLELPSGATGGPQVVAGGLVDVVVLNQDFRENPFWSQTRFSGSLSVIGQVTANTARLAGSAIADALVSDGPLAVGAVTTGPFGQTITYVASAADKGAPQAKARAATALTLGTGKTGETIAQKRATNLYKVTTTADNQVVHVQFSSFGAGWSYARPMGYFAPASGKFSEGQAFDSWGVGYSPTTRNALSLVAKKGDQYAAVLASDQSGSVGHTYTIMAKATVASALSSLKEPAGGDSAGTPLVTITSLDKAYYGQDGAIDTQWEDDFIKFVAKNTGKVYLQLSGPAGTTIGLGLRDGTCLGTIVNTSYSSSGTSGIELDARAGETYCMRITGGTVGTPYGVILNPSL